jgi:hypothetical protein
MYTFILPITTWLSIPASLSRMAISIVPCVPAGALPS